MASTETTDIGIWQRLIELLVPYIGTRRRGEDDYSRGSKDRTILRRALPGWQILMIAIAGIIGITIFSTHGEVLRFAGPGGLLVATFFCALNVICVMECIGELVILWPVSNAMVEYVRVFVDEDLAIVVGVAYWYAWSSVFATMITAAACLARYTIASAVGRGILFYVVIPLSMVVVNVLGVEYYGAMEGIVGIVKMLMILSGIIFMIVKAPEAGTTNLEHGFQNQDGVAKSKFQAFCVGIPILAFGYIGAEMVSVTAFEAKDRASLRFPARAVSYIIAGLYLFSALLQSFLVSYKDNWLDRIGSGNTTTPQANTKRKVPLGNDTYPVLVVAGAQYSTSLSTSWYFNACIIFFCVSAANTALYVASRTLFGLTRRIGRINAAPWFLMPLHYFGRTTPTRQVPLFALLFSGIAFYWLIPLQWSKGFSPTDTLVVMSTTASIGAIIVWASQCLAYLRYYFWLRGFRRLETPGQIVLPPKYNRWEPQRDQYPWHRHRMFLADFQPVPAISGLVGSLSVVFVFSSARWWQDRNASFKNVATAYAGPIILSFIFVCLKLWNRRWWVDLRVENALLGKITANLEKNSNLRNTPGGSSRAFEPQGAERDETPEPPNQASSEETNAAPVESA